MVTQRIQSKTNHVIALIVVLFLRVVVLIVFFVIIIIVVYGRMIVTLMNISMSIGRGRITNVFLTLHTPLG